MAKNKKLELGGFVFEVTKTPTFPGREAYKYFIARQKIINMGFGGLNDDDENRIIINHGPEVKINSIAPKSYEVEQVIPDEEVACNLWAEMAEKEVARLEELKKQLEQDLEVAYQMADLSGYYAEKGELGFDKETGALIINIKKVK